jgi:hypothetical protein
MRAPSVRAFQLATDESLGELLANSPNFSASNLPNEACQFATDELSVEYLASFPNFSESNLGALRF